jgi:catechol 2,3-dioxygenase-like lactoylglutathione lyase family enzyme
MPVRVLGYTWAGVRTSDLNSSSHFFSDILGLRRVHDGKGLVQFELPSGQLFEVFGSESRYYQFHNCPVVGFQVEDVRAAKQEMESRGIEFMTDVFGDDKEAWVYFRGPDGYLYEIWQTQRPLKAPLRSA